MPLMDGTLLGLAALLSSSNSVNGAATANQHMLQSCFIFDRNMTTVPAWDSIPLLGIIFQDRTNH